MTHTAITVDLDSTVADTRQRRHILQGEFARNDDGQSEKWIAYANACTDDAPIMSMVHLIRALAETHRIYFVSGRRDSAYEQTVSWLIKNAIPYDGVRLRAATDHWDNQGEFKYRKIREIELDHDVRVILHIDDWYTVKEYLEPQGIPTLHVVPPGFIVTEAQEEFA